MSQNTHPFLRIELLKFQLNNLKQPIDLTKIKTEIEIKEKNPSTQSCMLNYFIYIYICFVYILARIKKPIYNENNQCIRFDAGLFINIEREIFIRIFYKDILYTFESDLKALHKLADGFRHQVFYRLIILCLHIYCFVFL
jgi:hypothetical protein